MARGTTSPWLLDRARHGLGSAVGVAMLVYLLVSGAAGIAHAQEYTCFGLTPTAGCIVNGVEGPCVGTAGDDRIRGTRGDDVILGLEGNDRIASGRGDDIVCGGPGDDRIRTGAGNDLVDSDGGGVLFSGDALGDGIPLSARSVRSGPIAGRLVDSPTAGGRPCACDDSSGADKVGTGRGDDMVMGGGCDDTLKTGHGNDTAEGECGDDRLVMGAGDDDAAPGPGDDKVNTGSGMDRCSAADPGERPKGCEDDTLPACDDGIRNGDETGVDCGGSCSQQCAAGTGCASNADCAGGSCDRFEFCSVQGSITAAMCTTNADCGPPCPTASCVPEVCEACGADPDCTVCCLDCGRECLSGGTQCLSHFGGCQFSGSATCEDVEANAGCTTPQPTSGVLANIVDRHNEVRAGVVTTPALAPLCWDPTLAASAAMWAATCPQPGPNAHNDPTRPSGVGENISWGADAAKAVEMWAFEQCCYTHPDPVSDCFGPVASATSCKNGTQGVCSSPYGFDINSCGHYTQLVQRDATMVGCGTASCTGIFGPQPTDVIVCRYDVGNLGSAPPY